MSNRKEALSLTVSEARRLQINTAKHLLMMATGIDETPETIRLYMAGYIAELEGVEKIK